MIQAQMPLYIRFGEIPKDFQSSVHIGDSIVRKEGGVSVWRAIESNGYYFPILPENANEQGIFDYFHLLFSQDTIYLVTGTELRIEGADREPLLMSDIKIIKKIDYSFLKESVSK